MYDKYNLRRHIKQIKRTFLDRKRTFFENTIP